MSVFESICGASCDRRWTTKTVGQWQEIIIPRRGGLAVQRANRTTFAHSGIAVVLAPGEQYQIAHVAGPGGDTACSIFRVAAESALCPSEVRVDSDMYLMHHVALGAARAVRAGDCAAAAVVQENALALVDAIRAASRRREPVSSLRRERTNRHARHYVMRVRETIARRFLEPLTLDTVARAVGCSRYHLSRIITAHEGAPVYRLIIRHRLRHALGMVLETTQPLSTIALDSGFASQSHFGDAFRVEFGCAPGAARRGDFAPIVARPLLRVAAR